MVQWLIYAAFARGAYKAIRAQLRRRRPVDVAMITQVLKEVWTDPRLHQQLLGEWIDLEELDGRVAIVPLKRGTPLAGRSQKFRAA